jgi:hypothetical protein
MKLNNMRNIMLELLQQIPKQQRELGQAQKGEKRAAKGQMAAIASSPPVGSIKNPSIYPRRYSHMQRGGRTREL